MERILEILGHEFNVEILHKQYEENFLRSEIERREGILKDLKQLIYYDYMLQAGLKESGPNTSVSTVPSVHTEAETNATEVSKNYTELKRSGRVRGPPGIPQEPTYQYERRSDGVIVRFDIIRL
jgi:hypothetical protein